MYNIRKASILLLYSTVFVCFIEHSGACLMYRTRRATGLLTSHDSRALDTARGEWAAGSGSWY